MASQLNLASVDESYGPNADLYEDVLGVPVTANKLEIQQAYFERRDGLFQKLARLDQRGIPHTDPERYKAERRMDAVVMALRVLGNEDLRAKYNSIRTSRLEADIAFSQSPFSATMDVDEFPSSPGSSSMGMSAHRRHLKSAMKKYMQPRKEESPRSAMAEFDANVSQDTSVDFGHTSPSRAMPSSSYPSPTPPRRAFSDDGREEEDSSYAEAPPPPMTSSLSSKNPRRSGAHTFRQALRTSSSRRMVRRGQMQSPSVSEDDDDRATSPVFESSAAIPNNPSETDRDTVDDQSLASADSRGTTLSMVEARRDIFTYVRDEVYGAIEDTQKSVEQVLSAFTLQEDEIEAVFGRIDKAKRQMARSFT